MQTDFPLFPDQASSFAFQVDALYFGILALCVFFALLVVILVVVFAIKVIEAQIGDDKAATNCGTSRVKFWTLPAAWLQ